MKVFAVLLVLAVGFASSQSQISLVSIELTDQNSDDYDNG
jgi:hypothetical protein